MQLRIADKHYTIIGLFLIFLIAFAVRLLPSFYMEGIRPDSVNYLQEAKNILSRFEFYDDFDIASGERYLMPLYPLMTAIFSFLTPSLESAGRLCSIVFGSLTIIPVYFLARRFYSSKTGYVSAILAAFSPLLVSYSSSILTEALYIFITTVVIAIGWFAIRQGRKWICFLTGSLCGLSYLTRPTGIISLMIVSFAAFFPKTLFGTVSADRRQIFVVLVCLIIGFGAVSLPYIVYLHNRLGEWLLVQGTSGAYMSNTEYEELLSLSEDGHQYRLFAEVNELGILNIIKESPVGYARQSLTYLYGNFRSLLYLPSPIIIALTFFGLFAGVWTIDRARRETYLFMWVIFPILALSFHGAVKRYLIPLLPILIIWSGEGIVILSKRISESLNASNCRICAHISKYFIYIAIGLTIASFLPGIAEPILADEYGKRYEYKKAAAWARSNIPPDAVIMERKPFVAFYADRKSVWLPHEEYARLIDFCRYIGADYLLIDKRHIPRLRPQLAFLLDPEKAPVHDLKLVYRWAERPEYEILIYQILRTQ